MSIKDYEELKAKKVDYIKHCFENAKRDLAQGNVVNGNTSWILYKTLCKKIIYKKSRKLGVVVMTFIQMIFYFPVGKNTAYFIKEDGFIMIVASTKPISEFQKTP